MGRERECQAEIHVENCSCQNCFKIECNNCRATNTDHFTGKAIAKLLGWKRKEIYSPDNLQYLSIGCHRAKDRNTEKYIRQLKKQKKGRFIGLGEHEKIGL